MYNIDWKAKLSSRKLWAAVIAVIMVIAVAVFKETLSADLVDLIGKAVLALCVYIFGESGVDIARAIWNGIALLKAGEAAGSVIIKPPETATAADGVSDEANNNNLTVLSASSEPDSYDCDT